MKKLFTWAAVLVIMFVANLFFSFRKEEVEAGENWE